jgi:hypothetical protein
MCNSEKILQHERKTPLHRMKNKRLSEKWISSHLSIHIMRTSSMFESERAFYLYTRMYKHFYTY